MGGGLLRQIVFARADPLTPMPEFTSLSQIQVPVLGNSLAIGIVSLLHIAFAGLAVGLMLLAPLMEAFGRSNSLYLETAHSMTRFTLVTYTTSTVLAVIMAELFIGLFPQTNTWLFNQFRAPILVAIAAPQIFEKSPDDAREDVVPLLLQRVVGHVARMLIQCPP